MSKHESLDGSISFAKFVAACAVGLALSVHASAQPLSSPRRQAPPVVVPTQPAPVPAPIDPPPAAAATQTAAPAPAAPVPTAPAAVAVESQPSPAQPALSGVEAVPSAPVAQPAEAAPPRVVVRPDAQIAPVRDYMAVPVQRPRNFDRGGPEAVELYVSLGSMGLLTGIGIPFALGLQGDSRDASVQLGYSFGALLGVGAGLGAAALLDSPKLRTGIGPAISTGVRWGTLFGLLSMGTYANNGFNERENMALVLGMGLGGTVLGAGLGFGLQPHTAQVRFVESCGLWGMGLGSMLALTVSSAEARGGRSFDGAISFFMVEMGALLGVATGFALSAAHMNVSGRRGALMSLGFAGGLGVGMLIALMAGAASGGSPLGEVMGPLGGAGAIAGVVVAYLLTNRDRSPANFEEESSVQVGVAPTQGGAVATLNGRF